MGYLCRHQNNKAMSALVENGDRIREGRYVFAEGALGGGSPRVLRSINAALRLAAAHATEEGYHGRL